MASAIPPTDGIAGEQQHAPGEFGTPAGGTAVDRTGSGRDGMGPAEP